MSEQQVLTKPQDAVSASINERPTGSKPNKRQSPETVKPAAEQFSQTEELVDKIIAEVGNKIVLGLPIAIGKPVAFANALYQRAKADPSLTLRIETAITLEKPKGKSDLEKNFLEPFVEREFDGVPELDYMSDLRKGALPSNVSVGEFFFKAGSFLGSTQQQQYVSTNYTHAVRDLLANGVNVVAQLVAKRTVDGVTTHSLSSNSDLPLDVAAKFAEMRAEGKKVALVAEVNTNMPFMRNHAEVADNLFDFVLDRNLEADNKDYALFPAPSTSISREDHFIGLYASSLLKDGGTMQVGIGSLCSALTYSTVLRQQDNATYRQILDDLKVGEKFPVSREIGGAGTFEEGLYGCSELMVDGFIHLYNAGVLKREVFEDLTVQRLLNDKVIGTRVSLDTLLALRDHEAISEVLTQDDVAYLKKIGVFKPGVSFTGGLLMVDDMVQMGDLSCTKAQEWIAKHCLGTALKGGVIMHGAFYVGPKEFYQALHNFSDADHDKFCMTSVNYVNDLYDHMLGNQQIKQAQRSHARFINSTMMATLNGAVVSDALENGQVVSGVGGQYNFVAQSHQLEGARSILKLRSCSVRGGKLRSNILFNYGHTTIPRQLRDIVITEYGIADLRSKPDHVVYTEMIKIADSRFQPELLRKAKEAGKVPQDYEIPEAYRNNTPEALAAHYNRYTKQGLFGPFPFDCCFTDEELKIGKALKSLKAKSSGKHGKLKCIWQGLTAPKPSAEILPLLKRMKLDNPATLQERLTQRMLTAELSK